VLPGRRGWGTGARLPRGVAESTLIPGGRGSHQVVGQALSSLQFAHHIGTVGIAWGERRRGWVGHRTRGVPSPVPPPCPPCPLCSCPSILVWQPCIQTRCPSYLHWHRITLLEKSDSATSCLGFTTTWGGEAARGRAGGTAAHAWARQGCGTHRGGAEQHPDVDGEGCWWCPWRVAPSPALWWLGAHPAPPSPYLEGVAARWHVGDVDPLAVDVVAVGVPAPHAHPLLPKVGTGKASLQPCGREGRGGRAWAELALGSRTGALLAAAWLEPTLGAVGVLQAKAGLVPFGHLGAVERQQVIVGEDLDAVEVPVGTGAERGAGAWPGSTRPAQPGAGSTQRV